MEQTQTYYWWKEPKNKLHETIFAYIKRLDTDQSYRQNENFKHMRLYGNYDLLNLKSYQYNRAEVQTTNAQQNRVTLNIVQSMIDTVVSKITKNKPKPTFLTNGGDWSQQKRAELLTQFIEGAFQSTDFFSKSVMAFLDSCIFGTGAIKIFRGGKDGNELKAERIFIDELILDDAESIYGEPRQIHQRKYIHKDVLSEMFPQYALKINMVGTDNVNTGNRNTDMVLVVESWRLPSGPDAKDGRHTICIQNQTLFEEKYEKQRFPFVFWRWGQRPLGFFGQGLAEQLTGLQIEINKLLRTIQVSMHLVSVPKLFVEASSKVVSAHLDNKIGSIIKYAGTKPEPGQLGVIPQELFAHLDRLYSRAYEIAGVSQLSATAQKPAGLNSGKALREYNDLETERFMSVAQRYEKVFLDAAEIFVDLAKDIAADTDNFSMRVKGKDFLKTIKWKDVDMDEDQYVISVFPTSALSHTPAGRLADVQELIQAGFIGKEDAMRLLDFPDLKSFYNYSTASGQDINNLIERFVDKGEYESPEPFQNLKYGKEKMQMAYLHFKAQNLPEEKLELFRRWMQDADTLLKRAEMDAMQQQIAAQTAAQNAALEQQAMAGDPSAAAMVPDEEQAAQEAALAEEQALMGADPTGGQVPV